MEIKMKRINAKECKCCSCNTKKGTVIAFKKTGICDACMRKLVDFTLKEFVKEIMDKCKTEKKEDNES